jgi:hypothetical protein
MYRCWSLVIYIRLHVELIAITLVTNENYPQYDITRTAAAAWILGEGWTVYKALKKCMIPYNLCKQSRLIPTNAEDCCWKVPLHAVPVHTHCWNCESRLTGSRRTNLKLFVISVRCSSLISELVYPTWQHARFIFHRIMDMKKFLHNVHF